MMRLSNCYGATRALKENKQNPCRSDYLLCGIVVSVGILLYVLISLYSGTLYRDYPIYIVCTLLDGLCFLCALQQRLYYVFMIDGIYIYKRPGVLLTRILWRNVPTYTIMKPNRRSNYPYYLVLIMNEDAMMNKKLAITCSGKISDRRAKQYLLHRSAEQLARNKITSEQFQQQNVYLIAVTEQQMERAKKLWYNSR